MSNFDPAVFESIIIEDANETKSTPIPEGEYNAIADSVRIRSVDITKGERAGTTVPILEVMWQIMDDTGKLAELLNRDKIVVRQDIWLDVQDGALSFGPNLNVGLGRLREAVGLNKPGKPFSFKMIEGQGPVRISVTQKVQDSGDVYNNVSKVMKAGE